jgi:hypothetical protein
MDLRIKQQLKKGDTMAAEALTLHDEIKMRKNEDELLLSLDPQRVSGEDEYECMKERLRESNEINITLLKFLKIQKDENSNLKKMIASCKEEIDSILSLVKTMEAENQREM